MNKKVIPATSTLTPAPALILLQAEPQSLEIDRQRTAVIVIDMENAFVSTGGMWDLRGLDISGGQKVIGPIRKVISAVRGKVAKIVYVRAAYSPDLREGGGSNSPNWYKGLLTTYREHPEWQDKLLTRGTWGADIVKELQPEEGDIVVEKQRYSAFCKTNLDMILRTYNIKYLLFLGVATNICVEASIRDAYDLDYFPILVSDAVAGVGPPFVQEATIYNITFCFGWVTTSESIVETMQQHYGRPSVT